MKKKIIYLLISLAFVGCSKDFLELENKSELDNTTFYKTKQDVDLAVNACYTPLVHSGVYGLTYSILFSGLDDRLKWEKPDREDFIHNAAVGDVKDLWTNLYYGVYRTSVLIAKLKEMSIEGLSEEDKNYAIAQAQALRAHYYFLLLVNYHKPILYTEADVLSLTPAKNDFTNANPLDVWNLIESDLSAAIPYLETKSGQASSDRGRVTQGAAYALYGKAMLYKSYYYRADDPSYNPTVDLQKAKNNLGAVIKSGTYNLSKALGTEARDYIYAYQANFTYKDLTSPAGNVYKAENNMESVWELQYSDEHVGNEGMIYLPGWMNSGHRLSEFMSIFGYKNIGPTAMLVQQYEKLTTPIDTMQWDARRYATLWVAGDILDETSNKAEYLKPFNESYINSLVKDGVVAGLKKYHSPVYFGLKGVANNPTNVRVIRYADVLMMYSEACVQLGSSADSALWAFNEVRTRAGLDAKAAITRADIVHERDVEFAGECIRYFDVIRWGFDTQWGIDPVAIHNNKFRKGRNEYLPIPQVEIDFNTDLKQNSGY